MTAENPGTLVLFPYAAIFVAGAFVTMLMVKHGDVKPVGRKSLLERLDDARRRGACRCRRAR